MSESLSEAVRRFPPVVYAPTFRDEDGVTRLRMQLLHDGRVGLFVYTAIDRLQDQYGENASWALLGPDALGRAHEAAPYDLLLLDRAPFAKAEQS